MSMDPELAAKFARLRGETVENSKPAASKETSAPVGDNKSSKKADPPKPKKADKPKPKKAKTQKNKNSGGGFFSKLFGGNKKDDTPPQQTSDGSRVNPGIDPEFAAKLSKRRGDDPDGDAAPSSGKPKAAPPKSPKKKTPNSKKKKGGFFANFGSKKKKDQPPPQPASGKINPTLDPELAARFQQRRGESPSESNKKGGFLGMGRNKDKEEEKESKPPASPKSSANEEVEPPKEASRSLPPAKENEKSSSIKMGGFFGKKKEDIDVKGGGDNSAIMSRIEALERKNKELTERVQMLESQYHPEIQTADDEAAKLNDAQASSINKVSIEKLPYYCPSTEKNRITTMSLQDIPRETLEIYNKAKMGSRNLSSQVENHLDMCTTTQKAVEECFTNAGTKVSEADKFPEQCVDLAMNHMECTVVKRDNAMKIAEKLAGKAACEKVFPKYEENKKNALDLIAMYRKNAAGGKLNKDVFWG